MDRLALHPLVGLEVGAYQACDLFRQGGGGGGGGGGGRGDSGVLEGQKYGLSLHGPTQKQC